MTLTVETFGGQVNTFQSQNQYFEQTASQLAEKVTFVGYCIAFLALKYKFKETIGNRQGKKPVIKLNKGSYTLGIGIISETNWM